MVRDTVQPDCDRIGEVPVLVARLYAIVDELEAIFPGRHFTPDGHLVGSLGESLAAFAFGLQLNTASTRGCDALTEDGVGVEIKATQGKVVALSAAADPSPEERLLVLRLDRGQPPEVVYNGPAREVWDAARPPAKNGQRAISLAALRKINQSVADVHRLPEKRSLQGWAGVTTAPPA
jgi:hypothetical protein